VTKVSARTSSIDGLPTRATDRFIAGEEVPIAVHRHSQD